MDGLAEMTTGYHYTDCGLDYVYLANGYKEHDTPYGHGVAIEKADDLHHIIALSIIGSTRTLRGQEVRFLRSLLEISQAGIGKILGTSRPTIARWEGSPNDPIPGTADRALRLFYVCKVAGYKAAKRTLEILADIDESEYGDAVFEETHEGWEKLDLEAA